MRVARKLPVARLLPLFAVLSVTGTARAGSGKHPTLVDPAKAKCETCHEEILRPKVKHAAAEGDCSSCHEFRRADGKTTVQLTAEIPALCLACHDSLRAAAEGTLKALHAPVSDCTSCHRPHASDDAHLLNAPVKQVCAACHTAEDVNEGHPIPVSRADCLSCHLPHGGDENGFLAGSVRHVPFEERSCDACHRKGRGTKARFQQEGGALCFACHSDVGESIGEGVVHTALKRGQCTGCHDPHLSSQQKLLKAPGNETCSSCHPMVAAKASADGAHAPARKDCTTCHDAHRSENEALLRSPVPALCLECHSPKEKTLAAKHLGADLAKTDCSSCHDPHGSKQKHLLSAGSLHAPFESGCDTCHEGTTTKLVEKDTRALCLACHGDVADAAAKAAVPHAAMEGECTVCHTPHASAQAKLLRAPGGEVCIGCHGDQITKPGEVEHGVIGLFGCQSCHLPHGGANAKMLRTIGNDLCSGCHLDRLVEPAADGTITLPGGAKLDAVRAKALSRIALDSERAKDHPQQNHPVTGTMRDGKRNPLARGVVGKDLSCSSCHSPHMGRSRALFVGGAESASQLCLQCHPK
ncbi:MAG: cytochrome c3 family protein [Thermoanaerobaculia bacterium]